MVMPKPTQLGSGLAIALIGSVWFVLSVIDVQPMLIPAHLVLFARGVSGFDTDVCIVVL